MVTSDEITSISRLEILTKKFLPGQEDAVLQEWTSYKQYVISGSFQVGILLEFMNWISMSSVFMGRIICLTYLQWGR